MKKKILFIATIVGMIILVGCQRFDFEEARQDAIRQNAEKIFGAIDPNQDWNSSVTGTINITADAPLYDIQSVLILTESPYFNSEAKVLAEAEVQKGQTISLAYDAPNNLDRLIAACVDSKGHYYVKGFNPGEETLSFKSATTRSTRRASATNYPDVKYLKLSPAMMAQTFNAQRTRYVNHAYETNNAANLNIIEKAHLSKWHNSGWELDRMWRPTDSGTGTDWTIKDQHIVRDVSDFTDEEKEMLKDVFGDFLQRDDKSEHWGHKDNRKFVRESQAFKMYNNELTSDGETPITVSPIYLTSSENGDCHLYYYYYNPADIPSGMSEADYIKTLPKFKGIQIWNTKAKANERYNKGELIKFHEYLLPYYGEPSDFAVKPVMASSFGTFSDKLYRIRNGRQLDGLDYYMIHTPAGGSYVANETAFIGDGNNKLATKYDDNATNIDYQLWQIFTTNSGKTLLYNLGGRTFFVIHDKSRWETSFTNILSIVQDSYLDMEKVDGDNTYYFKRAGDQKGLGSDLGNKNNKSIFTNKSASNGDNFKWILEEYTGNGASAPVTDEILDDVSTAANAQPALAIPKGYRIGFMLRKSKNTGTFVDGLRDMTDSGHGCTYGFSGLNAEINTLVGHYESSVGYFSMEPDDPRCCYITANGKTYIGFEDGSDCQFNDMILEVGGYDQTVLTEAPEGTEDKGSGIETSYLYDENEIPGAAYMLLFEDRSMSADYDMNDVVLRCLRQTGQNKNRVELSLVAAGGTDDTVIMGIEGTYKKGFQLNGMEVHEVFDVDMATGYGRFVNTLPGQQTKDPCKGVYELPEGMTIPQFLANIYIVNKTTGDEIHVPTTGAEPLAIIMPFDFKYPKERQMITGAYKEFLEWAQNATEHTDWYNHIEENTVYPIDNIISK